MKLSNEEIARYSRHLIMPEVGMEGQLKLKRARVLCIGTGGLGSPLATYLAAAGVGTIGLVDADVVDFSNLQRQILHHTNDVGRPKVLSARDKLNGINPNVEVFLHQTMFTRENAIELCSEYDIVVDGTDNFQTRYLANDACVLLGKPNVHASIFRFDGQASVFWAEKGPCYRCLYPSPPPPGEMPSCAEGGVLGILPGLLGVIQATEVIKLILGVGDPLIGRLMTFDALAMRPRELKLKKNPNCPVCGPAASFTSLSAMDYEVFCGLGDQDEQPLPQMTPIDVHHLRAARKDVVLLDVREPHEWDICRIEGAVHIPLGNLESRLSELDPAKRVIVYCLMGGRSRKAQHILKAAGRSDVTNMEGGIRAWAKQVEPEMGIY